MLSNERLIKVIRRNQSWVRGEQVTLPDEVIFEGYAYFTTISVREREFLQSRIGDVTYKLFINYFEIDSLDDDCVIEYEGKEYDIVELRDEGMMSEFWGVLVKGKQ